MFVFNIKPFRRKRLLIAIAAVVLATAITCTVAAILHEEKPADKAQGSKGEYSLVVENGEYREFFSQLGIDSEAQPNDIRSVTIPSEFNKTYEDYNELQRRAGLDLSRYKGEQAQLLTFSISSKETPLAVLLVKDGRVIGGHLTNGEYGGEMLPLC